MDPPEGGDFVCAKLNPLLRESKGAYNQKFV